MARRPPVVLALTLTCVMFPGLALAQQPQPFPKPADRTAPPAKPAPPAQPEPSDRPDEEEPPPDSDQRIPEDKITGREVGSPSQPVRSKPTSVRPPATGTSTRPAPKASASTSGATGNATGLDEPAPTEAILGFPVFSGAQFMKSYNAGQGQRYYLFGATASYTEVVSFYRSVLRKGGNRVFDEPPVHIFEEGRFDERRMAFPPSVTVKDYTWGGTKGYLDPKSGAQPRRYPTVIQIVPAASGR